MSYHTRRTGLPPGDDLRPGGEPGLDVRRLVPRPDDRVDRRFRILNASNAHRDRLVLDPPAPITQIGSDGGLLGAPLAHEAIEIASAERYDVVIDFSAYTADTQVTLRNTLGSGSTVDVMRFAGGSPSSDSSSVPARLSSLPRADASTATVTAPFLWPVRGVGIS